MVLSNTNNVQITTNSGNQAAGSDGAKKPTARPVEPKERDRIHYIDTTTAVRAFQSRFGVEPTRKLIRNFGCGEDAWDEWISKPETRLAIPGIIEYLMRLEDGRARETLDLLGQNWGREITGSGSKARVFARAIKAGTVEDLMSRIRTCTLRGSETNETRPARSAAQTDTGQESPAVAARRELISREFELAENEFIAKFGAEIRERLRRIIEKETSVRCRFELHITILRYLITLDPRNLTQMLDRMDVDKWPWRDARDTVRVVVLARAIREEKVEELLDGIAERVRSELGERLQRKAEATAHAAEMAEERARIKNIKKERIRAFLAEISGDRQLQEFLALLPTYERVEYADHIPRFRGEEARKIFSIAYAPRTGPTLDGLFDKLDALADVVRVSQSALLQTLPRAYFRETRAMEQYEVLRKYWREGKGEERTREKLSGLSTNVISLDSESARIEIPKLKVTETVRKSEVSVRIQTAERARANVIIRMGMVMKVVCAELEKRLQELDEIGGFHQCQERRIVPEHDQERDSFLTSGTAIRSGLEETPTVPLTSE